MDFIRKMFNESSDVSMMRVMCLLSLVTAMAIAFYGMAKPNPDLSGLTMLTGAFLAAAFTGKVTSKYAEMKDKK